MKRTIFALIFFSLTLPAFGQGVDPPGVKTYYTTPLENDATRVVRLRAVTFPPKVDTGFHRHPGDQWNTVQEGEITLTIKGQAPRMLKAGDTSIIPRGTVHRNQNLTDKPVRVIELNIMDKDKPDIELVTETLPAFGQGVDSFVGTWKLNPAKSKFNPGPAPTSNALTFEAVGQGLKVTAEGVDAQGNSTKVVIGPYLYDGRSYPSPGASAFDASSYKMVNNSTVEITRTKAGTVILMETRVLSADGKTLTFTTTGQTHNIEVYEKQ